MTCRPLHRVSPPCSEASAKHSQDAEVAQEGGEKAPSARSAGSDKIAPSVSQRTPGQARKHKKRSYAGKAARCSLSYIPAQSKTCSCARVAGIRWGDRTPAECLTWTQNP